MVSIEVQAKKWGDSIAIIIPKAVVSEKNIKIGDKINISISRNPNIKEVFGILKGDKK